MPAFVLQQVSSPFARENAARTLEKPVGIKFISKYLDPPILETLRKVCPAGSVRIWGAKWERAHQFYKMPPQESIVLFRRGKRIFARGVIALATVNETLAESLWSRDQSGETWPLIFLLKRLAPMNESAEVLNPLLGRLPADNWQGLTALTVEDSPELQAFLADELRDESPQERL
jgi:hypothetical protein